MTDWEGIARLLANAVNAIGTIIATMKADGSSARIAQAADALTAIGAVVDTVRTADPATIDLAATQADLDRLLSAISQNDASADAALDDKFDHD